MSVRPVRVVVGRFDPLLRFGIADVLRQHEGTSVIADNLDGLGLTQAVVGCSAEVALLDDAAIRSVATSLRALQPTLGIIALVREPTPAYGMRLLSWRASCLDWTVPSADLCAATHLAAEGRCLFFSRDHRVERAGIQGALLTDREDAVLAFLIDGHTYEKIAFELGITVRTVKAHTTSLRRKLKAARRSDLIGLPALQVTCSERLLPPD